MVTITWSTNYDEQKSQIIDLMDALKEVVHSSTPAVVYDDAEPDNATILAAWQNEIGEVRAFTDFTEVYWYSPTSGEILQKYVALDSFGEIPKETYLIPESKFVFLEHSDYDGQPAVGNQWTSTANLSGYRHIWFFNTVRLLAGTTELYSMAPGNVVTANYYNQTFIFKGTTAVAASHTTGNTAMYISNGNVPRAIDTPEGVLLATIFLFDVDNSDVISPTALDRSVAIQGATPINTDMYHLWGAQTRNTLAAIDRIDFYLTAAHTFDEASVFNMFGILP